MSSLVLLANVKSATFQVIRTFWHYWIQGIWSNRVWHIEIVFTLLMSVLENIYSLLERPENSFWALICFRKKRLVNFNPETFSNNCVFLFSIKGKRIIVRSAFNGRSKRSLANINLPKRNLKYLINSGRWTRWKPFPWKKLRQQRSH